jgi:hypothetical protein
MDQSKQPSTNSSPKPPISERKLAANRANALRSTGPRTREGKQRSSMNALRHGILARSAFNEEIDGEGKRAEFDELVAGLAQEYQPRTTTEVMTVQQLAGCYWRLAKVWRYEMAASWRMWASPGIPTDEYNEYDKTDVERVVTLQLHIADSREFLREAELDWPTIPNGASARTVVRYQSSIQTMINRCIALLERRQKAREKSDELFEEVDYINEPTAARKASENKAAASTKQAAVPKRTQEDATEAAPAAASEAPASAQPPKSA